MNKLLLVPTLLLTVTVGRAFAAPLAPEHVVGSFSVEEIKPMPVPNGGFVGQPGPTPTPVPNGGFAGGGQTPVPGTPGNPGPIPSPIPIPGPSYGGSSSGGNIGQVISNAKDIVALGEAVYELVKKGKPRVQTDYAPINIVPKDPISKEYVDPMELEGASFPTERSFRARVKNGAGVEVVVFNYKVVYTYGASYNGTGKYLANLLIVPGSIKATHGWEFNSTAKLSGMMNHGTRADPVAGALITIKYNINSARYAFERNDTIHVTGRGEIRSFAQ